MKTVTTIEIHSELDSLQLGFWDTKQEEFIPIAEGGENWQEAARQLECSEALVQTLVFLVEDLKEKMCHQTNGWWINTGLPLIWMM